MSDKVDIEALKEYLPFYVNGTIKPDDKAAVEEGLAVSSDLRAALEEDLGHLLCLSGSVASLNMARNSAIMAARCDYPVYLFTVVKDEDSLDKGQAIIDEARMVIEDAGYSIAGEKIAIGDRIEKIIEEGMSHSIIVLSGEQKYGFRRFFKSSLIFQVLEGAQNSVMLSR